MRPWLLGVVVWVVGCSRAFADSAPLVTILSPFANATVSGTVSVTVSASDDVGIAKIDLVIDGTWKVYSKTPSLFYAWNTSGLSGTHTIKSKATDTTGQVGEASIQVTVGSSSPSATSTTTTAAILPYTGAKHIVLAVTGSGYTVADLPRFQTDAATSLQYLLSKDPYQRYQLRFQPAIVPNTTADFGCVRSTTMTRLIVCNAAAVQEYLLTQGVSADAIVVLVNTGTYGGSGGTLAVAYNGGYMKQVVTHELGHTFAGLRDEYLLSSSTGFAYPFAKANCCPSPPCTEWAAFPSVSYQTPCTYANWSRSTPCSLMRAVTCEYFNTVSKRVIERQILQLTP